MPDCRKPFLLRPIPRNPSRGRAPTRGGSIANTRSRSRSRHSAKQRSPGVTFYRPKALPSTNQGTGSDVMPQLLSAALAAQRSQCGGAVCIGPPPVSDRCYSRSRSTSRSRSGESYRMRMRNLYPVGSPDRSSRMGSVITKNTQTDAGLHLFSPRSCRTQSPAHRGHSPRFGTYLDHNRKLPAHLSCGAVRARSSSRGSSRRSVSSCGARLLPVDHLRTPLNASLRSASVPTRRSLIESSSLITRRSLTPSTFRSASPTADSPMTPPRMGLSSYPLNPPGSEHGQQCSPGLSLDGGESPRRVFDSPLGLDPISLLAPTYNQIDISPSRMPRASFPSKQTGPLDNVSFPLDGPATISKNSLGLLPSGEEDPLRHSDSAMRGLFTRMQSQINDLTKEVSDLRNTHRRSTPSTASVSGSTIGIIPPTPYIAPFPTLPPPVATLEIPHPPPIQSTSPIPPPPPSCIIRRLFVLWCSFATKHDDSSTASSRCFV
ncbi:hypothetical protein BS47DRAFT_470822 [Hydnum rufescens UP504]|uniref:Uncharacterized protein n=1 Tax=Hydnum rufescens UP504 TaxID=1448309 RepID=A0A9P6B4N6_9AGAM|nr:hypothetical protein BS47DRAFT_470822 [Hydnum rufescens UP504]